MATSGLARIRAAWAALGVDPRTAETLASHWLPGTRESYEAKWTKFAAYCAQRACAVNGAISSAVICNFLQLLVEDEQLAVATVEGYATAITSVLKACFPAWRDEGDLISFYRSGLN